MFRNYTYEDIKRFKNIDCFAYMQHPHFTTEAIPDILYSTETETIKTKQNPERVARTIKKFKIQQALEEAQKMICFDSPEDRQQFLSSLK